MKISTMVWLALCFLLTSCDSEQTKEASEQQSEAQKNEDWLVKVDGGIITFEDLDAAIYRTVGELASFQLDDNGRKKVLESVILSRIMAKKQMVSMSSDEQAEIQRQVKAYEEELLTKRYLKENIIPVPVTNQMVKDYYQKHPEKFGGKHIKTYEIIKGNSKLEGQVRDKLLSEIKRISQLKKWHSEVINLKKENFPIEYSKGASDGSSLNKKLASIIQTLDVNEVSTLYYIDGFPMILRVIDDREIKPKPLTQVRAQIRKSLAPLQLKKAVKKIAKQLLSEAKIEYFQAE